MHRMRPRQVGLGFDLSSLDHLMQAGGAWVCGGVDNMDIVRAHSGQKQIFA